MNTSEWADLIEYFKFLKTNILHCLAKVSR